MMTKLPSSVIYAADSARRKVIDANDDLKPKLIDYEGELVLSVPYDGGYGCVWLNAEQLNKELAEKIKEHKNKETSDEED